MRTHAAAQRLVSTQSTHSPTRREPTTIARSRLQRAPEIGLCEGAASEPKQGTEAPPLPHAPQASPGSTGAPAIDSRPD